MKLFISYRQEDTGGYCTDLCRMLQRSFGEENVFFDIKSIALGDDWVQVVEEKIRACDVLLLPIGLQWLTIKDKKGRTRLTNPRDPLRLEIEAAMRVKLRIVPLLVGGADMPEEDQLPGELRHLANCTAFDLRHASFDRDVDDLIHRLGGKSAGTRTSSRTHDSDEGATRRPAPPQTSERTPQPAPQPTFPNAAQYPPQINLTGTWQAATGVLYSCWQQGNGLVLEARNPFGVVVFRGQGTITGNQFQLIYDASYQPPYVVRGQATGVVSPDGQIITAQTMDQVTGVQPAQLRRVG
jgi:hypothetical protein